MVEFDAVIEQVLALTIWRREQNQETLTNRERTEREQRIRAQLPVNVVLTYDERSDAYGLIPLTGIDFLGKGGEKETASCSSLVR